MATLERCLRWALLLGLPLVLLGMALAPWLVRHVYAPALWPAAPLLQLLLIATWLMALDQLLSSTMLAAQAQRQDLVAMSLGLLALLALLVGLNQVWGLACGGGRRCGGPGLARSDGAWRGLNARCLCKDCSVTACAAA